MIAMLQNKEHANFLRKNFFCQSNQCTVLITNDGNQKYTFSVASSKHCNQYFLADSSCVRSTVSGKYEAGSNNNGQLTKELENLSNSSLSNCKCKKIFVYLYIWY